MKKLIVFALVLVMLASMTACSTVNKAEVSILWNDLEYNSDNTVKMVPNSLINAIERAMYTENIGYKHYDCDGNAEKQLQQAKKAVDAGCGALVVELVDSTAAQAYVDLAKGKNIPVIFLGCEVDEAVVNGYDKCFSISTKQTSVAASLSQNIADTVLTKKMFSGGKYVMTEGVDRDADGVISCMTVGECTAVVDAVNAKLKEKGFKNMNVTAQASDAETAKTLLEAAKDSNGILKVGDKSVELIITMDDATCMSVLTALRAKGFNKDRLKTHFVRLYTVGSHQNAKSLLNKEDYKPDEWDALVYTTLEAIADGLISGTAMEDYDTMAAATAKILKNLFKGKTATEGVESGLVVKARIVDVPYSVS